MIYFTTLLRVLALPLTLAFTWLMGRRDAKLKAAIRAAKEYQETMERMADVEVSDGGDATRERMRQRGAKR